MEPVNEPAVATELSVVEIILTKRLEHLKQLRVKASAEGDIGRSIFDAVYGENEVNTFESMIKRMDALIECGERLVKLREEHHQTEK